MSWLERFAVPEAARLDFRSGTKLDAVAHKLMSRRGATVFCMMAFITIGLTAFWHAEVTQRDRFEGAASATAIPMTTRSLQAVKNLLLAAWYPVALERCTSRPLAQLFIAIHAAATAVWIYDDLTTFPMPNATCYYIHRLICCILLFLHGFGVFLAWKGEYGWRAMKGLEIAEGVAFAIGLLAIRRLGPPAANGYPPGCSLTTGLLLNCFILPPVNMALTPGRRLRVADAARFLGLQDVSIRLRHVPSSSLISREKRQAWSDEDSDTDSFLVKSPSQTEERRDRRRAGTHSAAPSVTLTSLSASLQRSHHTSKLDMPFSTDCSIPLRAKKAA